MQDFVAIDFETANGRRSSVCSVGIVIVRGGVIVDRFYSLIQPSPKLLYILDYWGPRTHPSGYWRTTDIPGSVGAGCRQNKRPAACSTQPSLWWELLEGSIWGVWYGISRLRISLHPCRLPSLSWHTEPSATFVGSCLWLRYGKPPSCALWCRGLCCYSVEITLIIRLNKSDIIWDKTNLLQLD